MTQMITSFTGSHRFLSNFHTGDPFTLPAHPEVWWPTGEHAFQAFKASNVFAYQQILHAPTPADAKKLGRAVRPLPPWWENRKKQIMLEVLLAKFSLPHLREALAATGDAVLVEGNTWGDTYWGAVGYGQRGYEIVLPAWPPGGVPSSLYGHNWLGWLLMMVRDVIT